LDFLEIFRVSFLALKTNKIRSVLTTLGIVIGVASVILLISIGTGLQNYVTEQFQSLGSNVIYVMPGKIKFSQGGGGYGIVNKLEFSDVKKIGKLGNPIMAASMHFEKSIGIKFKTKEEDVEINGVDEYQQLVLNQTQSEGKWFSRFQISTAKKVTIVGRTVIKNLKINGTAIGKKIYIGDGLYTVIGILKSSGGGIGGADPDNRILVPSSTYIKYFGAKNPTMIAVKFSSTGKSEDAQKLIKNYYYKKNLTDDDFTVFDQKELLNTITQFLGVITVALGGIAAISLLVGGIGIMNIMLVSVTERTKEIGLRKAVGATPNNILVQFLIEAIVLSLVGGCLGIALGSAGSLLLSFAIKTSVSLDSVLLAFGVSSFVGIFFGVAPAIKASKLSPIEALRYE
jgi:putative ABC transport system permease protein